MKNETMQTPAGRVIFIGDRKLLTEEQLRLAIGSMSEDDPRWLAVNHLLDRELASAMLDSSSPTLDSTKGTHPGGRVAALAELKDQLVNYRTAPVKAVAVQAGKTKKA